MWSLRSSPAGRAVLAVLAALVLAVVAGLVLLWPSDDVRFDVLVVGNTERAEVVDVERRACDQGAREPCQILSVQLTSGPDEGQETTITLPGTDLTAEVEAGDAIRVIPNVPAGLEQAPALGQGAAGGDAYTFSDFERRSSLYLLAAIFAVVVVALARWKGVRALAGLALSLLVVTQFLVPAILDGSSPVLVALVGALAVMLLTIGLAHGTGLTSVAAVLGASVSLLATALLAVLFVGLAHITGFSSEEATLLRGASSVEGGVGLSPEGLILAGMVVGALGVLDDVTVSQASTVLALRRSAPDRALRETFREALSVGRDHLSATVNTLVLAYVGAALPVLLIFQTQGTSFGDAINSETVAGEVVAMLVGSIGLVLAVPLTTALATWLAGRLPREVVAAEPAHHHH